MQSIRAGNTRVILLVASLDGEEQHVVHWPSSHSHPSPQDAMNNQHK